MDLTTNNYGTITLTEEQQESLHDGMKVGGLPKWPGFTDKQRQDLIDFHEEVMNDFLKEYVCSQ